MTSTSTSTHVHTDSQLQTAVVKELDWSAGIDSEHIGVAVTDAAVTLSGEVTSLPQRNAAVKAAMRVHGVIALVDDITIRTGGGHYDDAEIARAVNSALGHHAQLTDARVHATVHHQCVTLTGSVDWHFQREAARRTIESITGVVDVVDEITVRAVSARADAEDGIRAALERGARRDAARIEVTVDGHQATLRGPVQSWKERNQVVQAAWSARGITHVVDGLSITG
jgi:osmotically-inducible protein OsmY